MRVLLAVADANARTAVHTALDKRGWTACDLPLNNSAEPAFRAHADMVIVQWLPESPLVPHLLRRAGKSQDPYRIFLTPEDYTASELNAALEGGADDFASLPLREAELESRLSLAARRISKESGGADAERCRAELAALRHAARLQRQVVRELFQEAPEAIAVVDLEQSVVDINAEFTKLFGYERADVLGKTIETLVLPPFAPESMHEIRTAAARGERLSAEGERRRKDGSTFPAWVLVSPVRIGGEHTLNYAIYRDISEYRNTAGELQQRSDQLEAVLQARNRLYARMSHEIRTPISAIMLYNELLLGDTLGPLNPEQHNGVLRAQDAAQHLLELIHDTLDLSKTEAGKMVLQPAEVDLIELVEDLLATVSPLAATRGSRIEVEQAGENCAVVTDPRRLRQVLLNLLSNAVKFGRGNPVRVRCADRGERGVEVDVADEGVGIAPEDLERIFDDFVQVGDGQEGGTGLGLAISQNLTQLLGGTLIAHSQLGEGSTFRLRLPRELSAEPGADKGDPHSRSDA